MRKRVDLNFNWQYYRDFKESYLLDDEPGMYEIVNLPHTNIELPYNYLDESSYQFISCYVKTLTLDGSLINKKLLLHFEGVMSYCEVYLNNKLLGHHKGGYTPFVVDITEAYVFNQKNRLCIKVDSTERPDIPPFGHVVDYLTYGGIYREVSLLAVENNYIKDLFIKTEKVLEEYKELIVDLRFSNILPKDSYKLEFCLLDDEKTITSFSRALSDETQNITVKQIITGVKLWDIDNPKLYHIKILLYNKSTLIDEITERFGFRKVEFKASGFYLNHKLIKLIGLNRHQAYPYVGYAMPKRAQYEDAEILKNRLGVNIVRLSHYPQSRHFLDRCDELGLLVFSEIPGWQHIGDSKWQDVAKNNLREMIISNYNHPSIVIWGVRINESSDCDDFYLEMNKIAKSLDDSRPTGGVRNFANSHLFEDVYTYNDFIHNGKNRGLSKKGKIINKNMPYLVTEHNGHMFPTKRYDHEVKRVEHALRHLRVLNYMYKSKNISGAIGWCMADYNTHHDFGSGDKICYHGVMDMFRMEKDASFAYLSQQDHLPVMHVSSDMNIGEYDASMLGKVYVFTNCDYVKLYKNNEYINTFYPDKKQFKYLPHPPIVVDDFIGDAILNNERFSQKDSNIIKNIFKEMSNKQKLSLISLIKMGYLMLKYKLSYKAGYDLYTKYVNNWGNKALEYHFKGYKDNKQVFEVIKAQSNRKDLSIMVSAEKLVEKETYDVARIELKSIDEYHNLLRYDFSTVLLEVEGPIEIIGPKMVSLIGGCRAFWVKTKGADGIGKIKVVSESFPEKLITLSVSKTVE